MILMFGGAVLEMASIGSVPAFVYLLSNPEVFFGHFESLVSLERFFVQSPERFFIFASVALILVFLLKNLFVSFVHYLKLKLAFKQQVYLGNRLFEAYLKAPFLFHLSKNSAETLRNVNSEANVTVNSFLLPLLNLILDLLLVLLGFIMLVLVEPVVSIFVLIVFGLGSFVFLYATSRRLKKFGNEEVALRKERNKIVLQTLGGMKELRLYQKLDFFAQKYLSSSRQTAHAHTYKLLVAFLPKPFLETFAVIGVFLISALMILRGREMQSLLPVLALIGAAAVKVLPALKQILVNYSQIRFNHFAIHPVYKDITTLEQFEATKPKESKEISFEGSLEIRNLSFKYPDKDNWVLKEMSATIPKGSRVFLSGDSGSGKTTFLNLLTGLLEPALGQILADGHSIYEGLESWQKKISYVPQSIFLFDDTIARNIAPGEGLEEMDTERLGKAIEMAQLSEFLESLPSGLNTRIGERGAKISGGQRQRIGIARALYHQPQILILDEATSEIDLETEKRILEGIGKLELSIIFVGHKMEAISAIEIKF